MAKTDKNMTEHTYKLEIVADNAYRIDLIELPNATDEEIDDGFENQEVWTELVSGTNCLFTRQEDFVEAVENEDFSWYGEEHEEGIRKLVEMMGDSSVDDGYYYPDAEEDFYIVVTDEDGEEVATIDSSDIKTICCEQGYGGCSFNNFEDEEAAEKEFAPMFKDITNHAYYVPNPKYTDWFWLSVSHGKMCDRPTFDLTTKGEFDPKKLIVKKSMVEETLKGLDSFEMITGVIYDRVELDYEDGGADTNDGHNYFIKNNKEQPAFPVAVYDMNNYSKAVDE